MYPDNDGERLFACRTAFHSTATSPCGITALSRRAKLDPFQHACAVCCMNERD